MGKVARVECKRRSKTGTGAGVKPVRFRLGRKGVDGGWGCQEGAGRPDRPSAPDFAGKGGTSMVG